MKHQPTPKLFIGGAPRSGTTLLNYILDNHRDIASFPFEHSTFEHYHWRQRKPDFFRGTFIEQRPSGQQSILANREYITAYSDKIRNIYGKEFQLTLDSTAFMNEYKRTISSADEFSLDSIFDSLYAALLASSAHVKRKESVKYVAFKQPFFTESFAVETAREIPHSKFIQLIRNPKTRYASAKKRRLDQEQSSKISTFHLNRRNKVLGHTEVDETCFLAAQTNLKEIGAERYKLVTFEELTSNPRETVENICSWLGVDAPTQPISQTILGEPAIAGSTLTNSKPGQIFNAGGNRDSAYIKLTSEQERTYHQHILGVSSVGQHFGIQPTDCYSTCSSFVRKFRDETNSAYLYRLLSAPLYFYLPDKNDHPRSLLQRLLAGNAGISGAT